MTKNKNLYTTTKTQRCYVDNPLKKNNYYQIQNWLYETNPVLNGMQHKCVSITHQCPCDSTKEKIVWTTAKQPSVAFYLTQQSFVQNFVSFPKEQKNFFLWLTLMGYRYTLVLHLIRHSICFRKANFFEALLCFGR